MSAVSAVFSEIMGIWDDPYSPPDEAFYEMLHDPLFEGDLREAIEANLSDEIDLTDEEFAEVIELLREAFPRRELGYGDADPVQSALTDVANWFDFAGPSLDDLILIHNDEYLREAVEELENWVSDAVWERLTPANRVEVIRRLREVNQMDEEDWREALLRRVEENLRADNPEFRARIEQIVSEGSACLASSSVVAGSSA